MKARFPHDALCRWDEPWWITDTHPGEQTMQMLREICGRCVVSAECALQALHTRAEGQVRAGVWLPERSAKDQAWMRARRRLQDKAIIIDPTVSAEPPAAEVFVAHGTPAGARWHYRRGEKPCSACAKASARDKRERFAKYREARSG